MSVYMELLRAMRTQLAGDLALTGEGGWPSIKSSSVVIRNLPHKKDSKDKWRDEATPGIILSPARSVTRPGGYNSHDFCHYPVVIQIIDRCEDRFCENALASWLGWEEAIAKFYHNQNARKEVWSPSGYLFHTWTDSTDVIEEQKMDFHHHMVMSLVVTGQSINPRNDQGSL